MDRDTKPDNVAFLREEPPEAYEFPVIDRGPVMYFAGEPVYLAPVVDPRHMLHGDGGRKA